jgi:hypothetical protein
MPSPHILSVNVKDLTLVSGGVNWTAQTCLDGGNLTVITDEELSVLLPGGSSLFDCTNLSDIQGYQEAIRAAMCLRAASDYEVADAPVVYIFYGLTFFDTYGVGPARI